MSVGVFSVASRACRIATKFASVMPSFTWIFMVRRAPTVFFQAGGRVVGR